MKYSASLQVHEMAKALFINLISKEDYPMEYVNKCKSEAYTIAALFYDEEVNIIEEGQ